MDCDRSLARQERAWQRNCCMSQSTTCNLRIQPRVEETHNDAQTETQIDRESVKRETCVGDHTWLMAKERNCSSDWELRAASQVVEECGGARDAIWQPHTRGKGTVSNWRVIQKDSPTIFPSNHNPASPRG